MTFTFDAEPLNKKQEALMVSNTPDRDILESNLIAHNYKMVLTMAHRYSYMSDFDDLVQEGAYGLVIAAKRFDVTRQVKFNSFAVHYIKKYILKHIYGEQRSRHISEDRKSTVLSIDGTLTSEDTKSLHENTTIFEDYINDSGNTIVRAMEALSDQERRVIIDRFVERKTLHTIGKELEYSLSNIKAIEVRALSKMHNHMNSCDLYRVDDVLNV